MKTKRKKMGNVGIRLKPKEPNLLENYSRYRKNRTRKKKKKKKKVKKPKIRTIQVKRRVDPMKKIIEDSSKHDKSSIEEIEIEELDKKESENKIIKIYKSPELSDSDPNVKKVRVDNIEEDKSKQGSGIKIE